MTQVAFILFQMAPRVMQLAALAMTSAVSSGQRFLPPCDRSVDGGGRGACVSLTGHTYVFVTRSYVCDR